MSEVEAWRPAVLGEAATAASTEQGVVEDRATQLLASIAALGSWWGPAALAALLRLQTARRNVVQVADALGVLASTLSEGESSLISARTSALNAVAEARALSLRVDEFWNVTESPGAALRAQALAASGQLSLLDQANRRAQVAHHEDLVREAYTTLDGVDREVAFAISLARDELVAASIDLSEGSAYVPPADLAGMTQTDRDEVLQDPAFWEWAERHRHDAKVLLDAAFDAGVFVTLADRDRYRTFLQDYWADEAIGHAGIDGDSWDPSLGTAANDETIKKVYAYYGQLFLDRPELQWAAMANAAGPTFGAAFFDLKQIREVTRLAAPGAPAHLSALAVLTDEELEFYETTFLTMQKKIFTDMGGQHEAYLVGGLDEIKRLSGSGAIRREDRLAWERIDEGSRSGDAEKLARGNLGLADREQNVIIAPDYDDMYARPGTGEAMTYLMTLVGKPAIPGTLSYPEFDPLVRDIETAVGGVEITTPWAAGNIADRDQRWDLIKNDTWPAFSQWLETSPEEVRTQAGLEVGDLMDDQRFVTRMPEIINDLTTWGVGVEIP